MGALEKERVILMDQGLVKMFDMLLLCNTGHTSPPHITIGFLFFFSIQFILKNPQKPGKCTWRTKHHFSHVRVVMSFVWFVILLTTTKYTDPYLHNRVASSPLEILWGTSTACRVTMASPSIAGIRIVVNTMSQQIIWAQ